MTTPTLPLVTIMVPCFNQAQYLEEAVESALAQSYANLEVMISDDGSTDGTASIAEKWHDHPCVRYFRNDLNLGRMNNYRETLFQRARGTYVLNLDGDDVLLSTTYIENAVRFIIENQLTMVFGKRVRLGSDYSDEVGATRIFRSGFFEYYLEKRPSLPHLSTLYHRETAMNLNFYTTEIISADRVSVLNMAFDHPVGYLDQVAGGWRETGENISRQLDIGARLQNVALPYLVTDALRDRQVDQTKLPSGWAHKYAGHIIANYVSLFILNRRRLDSLKFFFAALWRYPVVASAYGAGLLLKKVLTK